MEIIICGESCLSVLPFLSKTLSWQDPSKACDLKSDVFAH